MKRVSLLVLAALIAAPLVHLPAASAAGAPHLAAADANRIAVSYSDLTTEFYKHVDPQTVLNSVHDELDKTLKERHVKGTIPAMHASDNPQSDVRSIDLAVEQTQHKA